MSTERNDLPKKAFDIEYATQYRKEYLYLLSKGIQPTFIKRTKDYNVPVYKYKKTPELFIALYRFYEEQKNINEYDKMAKMIDSSDIKIDCSYGSTIDFRDVSSDEDFNKQVKRLVESLN